MSGVAIRAEGLGKKYRIGERQKYKALRDTLTDAIYSPFRAARSIFSATDEQARTEASIWALKDVSFEINQGEVVGVIGRNGAGKSTLLKILSRITEPTEGHVDIHGRAGSLLEVGTGFHPELTGRENIYLNGSIIGMKKAEIDRKFDEIVAFAEIEQFLDTPVKFFSSGMYMRLAFSVAAHLEPEILLVDEVLAVGDAEFQKKCLGKMEEVAKEGRTVIFVSHNLQAIKQFCSHSISLRSGRISGAGCTADVIEKYLKEVTELSDLEDADRRIAQRAPDPVFHLERLNVTQDGMRTTNVVSGKPVVIEVEYEVRCTTAGFHVYFELWDLEGNMLFESVNNGDRSPPPITRHGRYISSAVIPPDWLAPIEYELRIGAAIAERRQCLSELLCVPLTVQALGRVNRAYPGYRTPGKLAPLIPWSNEELNTPTTAVAGSSNL